LTGALRSVELDHTELENVPELALRS
jgi:hypothetical protein